MILQTRLAKLHEWVRVLLDVAFIQPCSTSEQTALKITIWQCLLINKGVLHKVSEKVKMKCFKPNLLFCSVGCGCRIHQMFLCRRVKHSTTSVLDMTLNNLMVRLQKCWSFEKCGIPLHCRHSWIHYSLEW